MMMKTEAPIPARKQEVTLPPTESHVDQSGHPWGILSWGSLTCDWSHISVAHSEHGHRHEPHGVKLWLEGCVWLTALCTEHQAGEEEGEDGPDLEEEKEVLPGCPDQPGQVLQAAGVTEQLQHPAQSQPSDGSERKRVHEVLQ